MISQIDSKAQYGDADSQFRLANIYALGQGTQKKQVKAYQWYTKAALQGYKKALIRIHNLYHQDKRMYCRGQLNSSEEGWADEKFKKEHNIRELNEFRREQCAPILNSAVDYYTRQFKYYKAHKEESIESDLNLAFLYQYGYGTRKNMILAFDFYKKAAEKGHKDAQYGLAYLYQTSAGIKFHYRLALRWYRTSATNGNIAAQNCLAYFYEKGLATEPNNEGALYWYTKAANAGSSNAQLTLGRFYRKGQGVEKSISEAIKWYKLAADQGNNAARNCLNQLYLAKEIPSSSVSQSPATFTLRSKLQKDIIDLTDSIQIKKLKVLAQHAFMTDGNAMYQVGLKYYNGEDFPQDKDIGFQWIKKAAKAGLKEAELKIAEMYKNGDAVDQDYHKSSIWTIKTVKKRSDIALLKLGILYKDGLGVRKDPLEASKWFIMSAERGNIHSHFQFGLLRYYGEGVRKDKEEAFEYFYRSALLGNSNALYQIGCIYENNEFLGIDIYKVLKAYRPTEDVIKLYELAANLGNHDAQFRLARIYEEGVLAKKDITKAHEYYVMATNSSSTHYQTELALKYINDEYDDMNYARAFNLFKIAADKNEPRAVRLFQIPAQPSNDIKNYYNVIRMFTLASHRGIEGIQYNLGHAYEHGIMTKNKVILSRSCGVSKLWYSKAAETGDSRAIFRMKKIRERENDNRYLTITPSYYSLCYENGNDDSAYDLALMYLHGNQSTQDFIKAFNLFTAASNMGHNEAYKNLQLPNCGENIDMIEAVASSGNVAIQYQLGIYFKNEDNSKSIKWLTMAAEGGVNNAYYQLGLLYEEGRRIPANYSKAIASYKKAIEQEHDDALYRLARIYHYGRGTELDYLKAHELYRKAANIGHVGALKVLNLNEKQNSLYHEKLNEESHVFSPDEFTRIVSMLEFVAERGDIDLQFELGYFYENSEGNQNYSRALKWYTMATATHHTEAMYRLGLLYEKGLGVKQDYNMSIQLYSQAKDQGNCDAAYRLGVAFHHGYGIETNPAKAVNYYTKAAKLRNHESQYALGKLYEKGELVERDVIKALKFYTKAYMNGNVDAISNLYNLYDYQSYESFFHQKLFQVLTVFEENNTIENNNFQGEYGYMYYCLGRMYLEGNGTTKNGAEALKRFLIAEKQYGYTNVKPFTAFIYDENRDDKYTYIERMKSYYNIRDTLDSEQQYRIGMLYYNDAKCFYEEDPLKEENSLPLLVTSKEDNTTYPYFQLASKNDHKNAQYQLGIMHLFGHRVHQNKNIATEWIQTSIETTDLHHYDKRGMNFYNGNEAEADKSYKIAFVYIKKAAEKNHEDAQFQLGVMYLQGYGVKQNSEEAMKWFQQSSRRWGGYRCYSQGMKFYLGNGFNRNYETALLYIKNAAEKDDREAQIQLGIMYLQGQGVDQNSEEAKKWLQQSTNGWNKDKCYRQGMKFYQGNEVDKNDEIALLYIKNAAEKDHSEAQIQLGIMHLQGQGIEQNYEEAMKWFQQSARGWGRPNFHQQGMNFYQGDGVDKNYESALFYLKKAVKKDYSGAQFQAQNHPAYKVGQLYHFHGDGIQDSSKAIEWYRRDLESRLKSFALHGIGLLFEFGDGVAQDYHEAFEFYTQSSDSNNMGSLYNLGLLYYYGKGVDREYDTAFSFFIRVAKASSNSDEMHIFIENINADSKNDASRPTHHKYSLVTSNRICGEAHYYLGLMCKNGQGTNRSEKQARIHFEEAFERGAQHAASLLK